MTNSPVPAGTVALNGVVTNVPDCAFIKLMVVVPICVSVPAGNAAPPLVYKRNVTGC